MLIDLRSIQAFLTVYRECSLGHAANSLHVTQSGLSRIIARLEDRLGVKLFDRLPHGMSPTIFGETLLPHAENLMNETDNALEELRSLQGLGKGLIKVGAIASAQGPLLAPILDQLLRSWPNLSARVLDTVESKLVEALLKREIDIAIAGKLPETEGIVPLGPLNWQDRFHIIARTTHPIHARRHLTLASVRDENWVMPARGHNPRDGLEKLYRDHGMEPPSIIAETSSIHALKSFVFNGDFLTWIPAPICALEEKIGLVKPLPIGASVIGRTSMIYTRRGSLSPPARMLLRALRAFGQ